MKKNIWTLLLITIWINCLSLSAQKYKSGDAEIDKVRAEVKLQKTTDETHFERTKILYVWLGALQQQGARTFPFFDLDLKFRKLETKINRLMGRDLSSYNPTPTNDYKENSEYQEAMTEFCRTIDESYELMNQIQKELTEDGPMFIAFEADTEISGGDLSADWPMFQADIHNTGATTAPGPSYGREKWKFPVGLGWYARPVIEGDKVYVTSPGMRVTGYCLDLKTGKEIWRSSQEYPRFYLYDYPVMASSPLLISDQIVLREIRGKGIVFLDKETGETEGRLESSFVDYRTRYTPISGKDDRLVYPVGEHNLEGLPPSHQNFNRLVCVDAQKNRTYWDFNVGDIDALAEPVISGERVFQGTMEGYLYALNLTGESGPWGKKRIDWKYKANGSVNTAVLVEGGRVYFGANGGSMYCLDEQNGNPIWEFNVQKPEKGARKHFTTPVVYKNRLYVGGADKHLYCIDAINGKFLWKIEADDWIRARPVVDGNSIHFATLSGRLYNVNHDGKVLWDKKISNHAIYTDLVGNSDELLLTSCNLMLHCIGKKGKKLWEKSIICSFENEQGERIYSDQVSGGTWFQSKPTATDGKLYFGTPSGFLHCVNAESGEEIWKFEMGGAISVGAAIADGKVYAGQQGGERFFYCLDAEDGSLIWKQTLPGGWVWGSATVDEGLVYIPTCSGYAVCLDGETGHMVWMYPTARGIPAEPAIDGDLVYFGSWSRSLYAFNKKTGEIVWKAHGIVLDSGTLIARNGKIYLPDHSTMYNYFDGKSGELLHSGNTNEEEKGKYSNFNGSPAFVDGKYFCAARVGRGFGGIPLSSRVYCVDPLTAEIHWTFPDGGGVSAPALASGRVYIASGNTPFFYCLDQKTGLPHWIVKLGNRVEESTLCIYRKMVYVLSVDGYVHAIE
jgi:outer membrane protein assembly factor BamB